MNGPVEYLIDLRQIKSPQRKKTYNKAGID